MTAGVFDDGAMVSTVLRVRDVGASVRWYRGKLGLEPIHVGADGDHPLAVYRIAGSVVSLWQLPVVLDKPDLRVPAPFFLGVIPLAVLFT